MQKSDSKDDALLFTVKHHADRGMMFSGTGWAGLGLETKPTAVLKCSLPDLGWPGLHLGWKPAGAKWAAGAISSDHVALPCQVSKKPQHLGNHPQQETEFCCLIGGCPMFPQ